MRAHAVVVISLLACSGPDARPAPRDRADDSAVTGDSTPDETGDSSPSDDDSSSDTDDTSPSIDADGDGTPLPEDCDDANPYVHPGAPDQCDAIDQDCDGSTVASGACAEQVSLEAGALWIVDHTDQVAGGAFLVGDVTGDGLPDLLDTTAGYYTLFPGGPVPDTPWALPDGGYHSITGLDAYVPVPYYQFEAGDVDGDGLEDLGVVTDWQNCLLTDSFSPFQHRHHDMNADGYDDIFVESGDGTRTGVFLGFDVPWDDPGYW